LKGENVGAVVSFEEPDREQETKLIQNIGTGIEIPGKKNELGKRVLSNSG
jgi:hypothetical protein